jgi:biopolymer transport protein ExbD/biopolymer transport protein TolR
MGMSVGNNDSNVRSDINVVPLVDIVLVLLIIFIVITPAINDAVNLPLSKHSVKQETDPSAKYLSLILTRKQQKDEVTGLYTMDRVLLDDPSAGPNDVFGFEDAVQRTRLIDFVKKNIDTLYADKRVFIKADSELPFHYVNELFQICREAGADEASIVTSEDKSGEAERAREGIS